LEPKLLFVALNLGVNGQTFKASFLWEKDFLGQGGDLGDLLDTTILSEKRQLREKQP
jgi:hypothetical protein